MDDDTSSCSCAVCGAPATQKCSSCRSAAYCNRAHQKQAWRQHKSVCRPWAVRQDAVLGRHLVATRRIRSGEVVIQREAPLVCGPPQLTAPVCLGECGHVLKPPAVRACNACGWPMCGAERCRTAVQHQPECEYTRKRGDKISISNYVFPHPNYQCITVLRILYQRDNNKKLWDKLMLLQSHCEERKGTEKYEKDRVSVAQFIRRFFKLEDQFTEEEIMRVCGILQVNGHEIPLTEPPYVAIYEHTSMFEHSCRPNCCKSFTSEGEVLITAGQDIEEGTHLSICYTDSLWGTPNRRHYLAETKFFSCSCERCTDPTEFGTFFSALKCTNKDCKGYVLPDTFLVDPKKDFDQIWKCSLCAQEITSNAVENTIEHIGRDLNAMQKGDPRSCRMFLEYYERLLHPNHFYLTDVRLALSQLIGQENADGLNSTPEADVEFKAQLCTRLVDLIYILNPAEVRVRGTLLFELHAAVAEVARRRATCGTASPQELRAMLMRSREILADAVHLLQHEPDEMPEGKIAIQARKNLQNMDELLRTLHNNIGDTV